MRAETNISLAGAGLTQLMQAVSTEYVVLTIIPSLLGALMHTINKARREELTRGDIIIAFSAALAVGAYAGPWFAEMAPATQQALPIFCYGCALYAKSVAEWLRHIIENLALKIGGGKNG